MPTKPSPHSPLVILREQLRVFEEQQIRAFAGEVASRLSEVAVQRGIRLARPALTDFALDQLRKGGAAGLKKRDELMAFALCALVHGDGFHQRLLPVREILTDVCYDRATLLAQLAISGLKKGAFAYAQP